MINTCMVCGKEFEAKTARKSACSPACYGVDWKERHGRAPKHRRSPSDASKNEIFRIRLTANDRDCIDALAELWGVSRSEAVRKAVIMAMPV